MFPAVGGTLVNAAHNVRRGELNQLTHYVRSNAIPGDLVVVVDRKLLERLEVVLAEVVEERGHALVADLAVAEVQLLERR